MPDRVPVRRDVEQGDRGGPAGAAARHQHHLGVAALRPVRRRRPLPPRFPSTVREPVVLAAEGLQRLLNGLRALGIGADYFPWPPPGDPSAPRIGAGRRWKRPMRRCSSDATPRFCAAWMCCAACAPAGVESLFVILGPSGAGSRRFCGPGCCPGCAATTAGSCPCPSCAPSGRCSPANSVWLLPFTPLRSRVGLCAPMLGEIKNVCHPEHVERLRELAGGGPPGRPRPAAGCARRAARPHAGAAGGSGRGTVQRRRRTRGRTLPGATGRLGRA